MNRPELIKLLNLIEEKKIDLVVVSELSRLSRSIRDFSQIWEFFQSNQCGMWSLRENFDTSTAAGEMMLYSIANFAQFERKQTAERVSANFQARASRGLYNGGTVPIGYEIDRAKGGHLKIDEEAANAVKAAFLAMIREGSIAAAAKWLNLNAFKFSGPTRASGSKKRLNHFNVSNLRYLLNNRIYMGIRRYQLPTGKFQDAKSAWPSIIDEETFALTQEALKNSKKVKIMKHNRYPYLLSGKVACAQCGQNMVAKSATGNSGRVHYYEHASQSRRDGSLPKEAKSPKCDPYRIQVKKLDRRVLDEIMTLLSAPALSKDLFAKARSKPEQKKESSHEQLSKQSEAVNERIQNILKRISELPAAIPANTFYQEIERLQEEKRTLDDQMLNCMNSSAPQIEEPLNYEQFLVRLQRMVGFDPSFDTQKTVVNSLVHRVLVDQNGFKLEFYVGVEQLKKGEALLKNLKSLDNKFSFRGSFNLKNGWIDDP